MNHQEQTRYEVHGDRTVSVTAPAWLWEEVDRRRQARAGSMQKPEGGDNG